MPARTVKKATDTAFQNCDCLDSITVLQLQLVGVLLCTPFDKLADEGEPCDSFFYGRTNWVANSLGLKYDLPHNSPTSLSAIYITA
jgi:hypothetical protein